MAAEKLARVLKPVYLQVRDRFAATCLPYSLDLDLCTAVNIAQEKRYCYDWKSAVQTGVCPVGAVVHAATGDVRDNHCVVDTYLNVACMPSYEEYLRERSVASKLVSSEKANRYSGYWSFVLSS